MSFDFNYWNKALDILNFTQEAKDDILQNYNALLTAKMAELAGLTETDPVKLLAQLSEKFKTDPKLLKKTGEYLQTLNSQFMDTFAQQATPEQKEALIAYFGEYKNQLQSLSELQN